MERWPLERSSERPLVGWVMRDAARRFVADGKALGLAVSLVLSLAAIGPAQAGWWKVLRGADDAGGAGTMARLPDGFGALDDAARHIGGVAAIDRGIPLAGHATPEGHWKFVNKSGEIYTAGNAGEMQRVVATLAPAATPGAKISLYLSDATVFDQRAFLDSLPANADLYLVDGRASYRLIRRDGTGGSELLARVRPNIAVSVRDRRMFNEAMFQLARPLNTSNIRVLALEPGGPRYLPSSPRFDPATKAPQIDALDPAHAQSGFAAARGQTVVVTGRVEAGRLRATSQSGHDIELPVDALQHAAEQNDVNLVVLRASVPRQPGGRNWLWQKVEIAGLDDALKRASFADFLNALAASRGELTITAVPAGQGRVSLRAVPSTDWTQPVVDDVFGDVVSHVTGNIVTQAVQMDVRDREAQVEQDARLVSWLPSTVHVLYGISLVLGLVTLPVLRDWWLRVWPREQRGEYRNATGYAAARLLRGSTFLLVFLPLAAWPAAPVMLGRVIWAYVMLPVRFLRWLRGSQVPTAS
jgi:hypothetical protein